jgi:hypothetical protein
MSDMRDVNKKLVAVGLRLELLKKIERRAVVNERTTSGEIVSILEEGTRNIVLSSYDYEQIAKEVKKNELKRKSK